MFLRLVAIVGLIAVLILGAWGIILLAFNLVGIFTGSVDLKSLFTSKTPTEEVTTPVVTTKPATSGTQKPATTGTTAQPTAVYTAAPRVSQLYGLADLKVTVTSVNSLSSYQGRTVVQFMVENVGTNVALSGWSFNAQLPMMNAQAYTYQSQAQQALYPGDSIAYTLTYDDPNYRNGYNNCSTQYPYTCTYQQYNNQYYQPYQNTGTCYTFNGYQNVAGPCPLGYDQNGNPLYGSNNQYYYQQNYYNPNYNYNYNQNYGYRTVTVTVDPQNWVPEAVEYNNTSSKSF